MRVGKKPNVVEAKKTRSCVVRLEKFSKKSPNVSPSPEDHRKTTRLSSTAMAPTPKQRRGGGVTLQQEEKPFGGTIKKRIVGGSNSNLQTPQQKATNTNMSNIRSNQKIKIIPRSNKTTPASTPSREETPPPTIAAGRSRRAIKPNPKYASEDLVTPKVVRNVATLGSSTSRGSTTAGKTRKASTSSDDFYNRNSDDEYDGNQRDMDDDDDEDMRNDKAYQANDKDENDSDFSVIEEQPVRAARPRGRPKRVQEPTLTNNKLPTLAASSNVKRTTNSATVANSSNLRSAPSQLQQIRRSLASANAQRNINLLSGTAQKRKLEELQDSSDNESSYTIKRKQLVLSNSTGPKVIMPVKENRVNASSTPLAKSRLAMQKMSTTTPQHMQQPQTVNGSNKINNSQTTSSRRAIEISAKSHTESITKSSLRQTTNANAAMTNQHMQKPQNQNSLTTQAKILAAKSNRLRIGSPKLPMQKERQNNGSAISISSGSAGSSSSLNTNSKTSDKTKALNAKSSALKSKTTTSPHNTNANSLENINEIKDDSPNSTMDDFETMPTFTIVNVNDIINKKGDVLITKAKANNNSKTTPTVIEFSESISLDDDDDDDDNDNDFNDDVQEVAAVVAPPPKKLQKLSTLNNRKEFENNRKSPMTRSSESLRKLPTKPATSAAVSSSSNKNQAPQILNHKLGLRNSRVSAKATTTLTATLKSPDKPAPRILNSVVGKKTQPVKPMISNMDDSADESFPLSLDEDDDDDAEVEEETEDEIESRTSNLMQMTEKARKRDQQQHHNHQNLMEVDTEDTESQNTEEDDTVLQTTNNNANFTNASNAVALTPKQNTASQRRRRTPGVSNTPIVVSSNKKRMTPAAAKENSLAATNQQINDTTTGPAAKQSLATTLPVPRKSNAEKVVISKQGDKIIKKITCFETWYVINMPMEAKRPAVMKNQLEMPLIRLANNAKNVCLPNDLWSSKVTLYELSAQTLGKGTFAHFTGDLYEHHIKEEDRGKYQPSCVMFRRSIEKNHASRMPYDRAVIFKNKTFYTNIEGKNVRLVGAPSIINTEKEIEILLEVVDGLTLQSDFVEHISIVQ